MKILKVELNLGSIIDKEVFYAVLNKGWSLAKTPLTLFFITRYLSISEQGYWYTFISLGALTVFAELGFTNIVIQFISHEFAHLRISENKIQGETLYLERLISLIKFSSRIYFYIIPAGILLLSCIGVIFFSRSSAEFNILIAWITYSFIGGFTLFISFLGAVLQGLNKVVEVLKATLVSNVINTLIIWFCLYVHLNIWALSIGGGFLIISSIVIYYKLYHTLLTQVLNFKTKIKHNWLPEILPLQIKYSITWISGYFIFNFIVPVTMYFLGAANAGKLGISIALTTSLLHVAHSWMSTKIPLLNNLVSKKDYVNLNNAFSRFNLKSISVYILGAIIIISLYYFIFPYLNLYDRFIGINEIILLLISEFSKLIVGNWAIYLRAFKKERYLYLTILNALFTAIGLFHGLYYFKSLLISLEIYTAVQLFTLIPAWIIFNSNNKVRILTEA